MKSVKKLLRTILFFVIGIFLFQGISYTLRPLDDTFSRRKMVGFYAEEKDSLDIVGIGSSALYFYFNNFVLWKEENLTSYNYSTANQSNFIIEQILDEIKKTQSPQLYIIETRKFLLAEEKSENEKHFPIVVNNMKYSLNRIELINHLYETWQERISYYFDIIMYHDNWEKYTLKNLKYIDNKEQSMTKGWTNRTEINHIELAEIVSKKKLKERPISEASEKALRSLLEKCKKENIPVLFISTPFSIRKTNQEKNAYLGRIIEEEGFLFLDCNQYQKEIGLDNEKDFVNKGHVNMLGAEKVTRFIGKYIQEHFQLSTEHKKKVVEHWKQAAELNAIDTEKKLSEMFGK